MSAPFRQLPLSRLGHLIPPLVDAQALIALVPTTADDAWAAKAAWDIARIASREGRRVALVDLRVDHPALHQAVGLEPGDGIVDAFEYGVSLTKTAHEVDGVFFISTGSPTAGAGDLYAHPRWQKLQAGFRSEGALLLLFVSANGLKQLSAVADGAIVLAPEGLDPASAAGADVAAALERGTPLLGVARDRWTPAPQRLPSPRSSTPPQRWGKRVAVAAVALGGAAVAGWASFVPPAPPPPRETAAPVVRRDTLGWTIQLAAYGSLDKALAHADRLLDETGVAALVTPVPQGDTGPVWYRVLAGSYATRTAAADARAELWRRGTEPTGIGDLLHAPYSYAADAGQSLDSLRGRGLPAVRWPATGTILLGAFESPEQAAFAQAALARAGVHVTLLPRMGTP